MIWRGKCNIAGVPIVKPGTVIFLDEFNLLTRAVVASHGDAHSPLLPVEEEEVRADEVRAVVPLLQLLADPGDGGHPEGGDGAHDLGVELALVVAALPLDRALVAVHEPGVGEQLLDGDAALGVGLEHRVKQGDGALAQPRGFFVNAWWKRKSGLGLSFECV